MKNDFRETINGIASTASTECTNNQQWTKYHNKHGHGFAAEDANAFWDRMHGKTVEKVGYDNSLVLQTERYQALLTRKWQSKWF